IELPLFFDESSLDDLAFDPRRDLGAPGEFPYTRGPQRSMYRGKLWTMRQYAGFSTAVESNKRYRYLLERGTTGLSVAFDLPTQIGMDSDDTRARGEVGKVGVAIDSIGDMETLFDQIPLDRVSISMTINAPASILLAMLLVVAERRGIEWSKLSGTIQNDILKEYAARGAKTVGNAHARAAQSEGPAIARPPFPRPDRRLDAHRATAGEQCRPRGLSGDGGGPRRLPVAPHELARRGAGPADRGVGEDRA